MTNPEMQIEDIHFDEARNVHEIQYRLHPVDVGFDLRAHAMAVRVSRADDPMRVSYPRGNERRVMSGPQDAVLRRLRRLGFRFWRVLTLAQTKGTK